MYQREWKVLKNLRGQRRNWVLKKFPLWLQESVSSAHKIQDHHVIDSTEFEELFLLKECLISSFDCSHPVFYLSLLELLWPLFSHCRWIFWNKIILPNTSFSLNRITVWAFFTKHIKNKHLCWPDKNYYFFSKLNIPVIN